MPLGRGPVGWWSALVQPRKGVQWASDPFPLGAAFGIRSVLGWITVIALFYAGLRKPCHKELHGDWAPRGPQFSGLLIFILFKVGCLFLFVLSRLLWFLLSQLLKSSWHPSCLDSRSQSWNLWPELPDPSLPVYQCVWLHMNQEI
jgi:hypothetical protein